MLPSPHLQDYKITLSATISQEILIVALIIRPLIFFNSSFSPACLSLIFYPITWPKRVKNSFISPMIKVVSIFSSWSGVHGPMDFHFFSFFLMSHLIFYTFSSSMWERHTIIPRIFNMQIFSFNLFILVLSISSTTSAGASAPFPIVWS